MDAVRPAYYAVIPADVRYDDRISDKAKLLYGEIAALTTADGYCFASNSYFAKLYGVTERTISASISALQEQGYIHVVQDKDPKTGKVVKRQIFLKMSSCDGRPVEEIFHIPRKYFRGGVEENFQDINLSISYIEKENKKEKEKEKNLSLADDVLNAIFIGWIENVSQGEWSRKEKNGVYFALCGFYEPRQNKKQEPARTKAAFTALSNRLVRYSKGKPAVMIDMLERATTAGWKSVFPLNQSQGSFQSKPTEERAYKCV